ncbi:MAG TPA: dipeptide ABC transporter ATP-binding protein [Syntrophales bacterium]|nr:dipeptide ABC transporter ATP-binding protein [Syntrophales bacterium]
MTAEEFVVVRGLKKAYPVRGGLFRKAAAVTALDGVDFSIAKGETLGLVGESGCGKSTLGRLLLRLEEPDGGSIRIEGTDIFALKASELQKLRRNVQIIFQDPYSSLNPRKRVDSIVGEPLAIHGIADGTERDERVIRLLETVGLRPEQRFLYPHQFSGGQRQRIGIARALALNPSLVVADEPVSSLDVSIQAQIVNLLQDLQERLGLTYLFISHDLNLIEYIADRVIVMYLGKIMEIARSEVLCREQVHPYSEALFSASPSVDPETRGKRIILKGDVPSPIHPPPGCRFHTRCPLRIDICDKEEPPLTGRPNGSRVACHVR